MALLMLTGLLLMSFLPMYATAQIRAMCVSQFSLANQACAVLSFTETPKDANNTGVQPTADDDDDDDDDNDNAEGSEHHQRHGNGSGNRQSHSNGHSNRQSHRNGHGNRHSHGNGNGNRQRHEHGHEHRNSQREEPRANRDCCRWLDEVDESCVCTALLRLPPFLIKPKHQYSIKVGNTCGRTFKCQGI